MNGPKDTLTADQAVRLHESRFWERMSARAIAKFQLNTKRLCMPFGVFHKAVEEALGRPVYLHEFARPELLRAELAGDAPAPTSGQIIGLIPEEKRVVVVVDDPAGG